MTALNKFQRQRAEAVREILVAHFPRCFKPKGQPKQPLALKLHLRIRDRIAGLSRDDIFWALKDYTGGPTYLKAMIEGAARIGLDGEIDGVVDAQAAAACAHRLLVMNRIGVIRTGLDALQAAVPLLRVGKEALIHGHSVSDADGNPIPGTMSDQAQQAAAVWDGALAKCEAAIKQGEACL